MNDRDLLRFDRAIRIQSFARDHAADFPAGTKAAVLLSELDAILAHLPQARVGQLRSPVAKESLLDALFTDFKAIARTSRAIALEDPAFRAADFRFPPDYNEATAITHAAVLLQLFAEQATDTSDQHAAKAARRDKFIAYEIRPDFVEDLQADVAALHERNSIKHTSYRESVENTSAISTPLGQAQSVITRLDALIKNKFAANPDKLAAWKHASHVERTGERRKAEPIPSAPLAP